MLELHVSSNDVTSGSIGVGWCVSPDTLKELAERGVKNPGIVLFTSPKGKVNLESPNHKEFRTVVALKDLVAYVSFKTSGFSNVWGFIVSDVKRAKQRYLEKSDRVGWKQEILSEDATMWPMWNLDGRLNAAEFYTENYFKSDFLKELISDPIEVFVPNECFAPEPAEWEKTWVNYFFTRKVMDQCEFRRRRIVAYTLQPLFMTLNIAVRALLLTLSTVLGLRAWSIGPLLHPVTVPFSTAADVLDATKGTYFVGQGKSRFMNWIRLPFMPAILLLLALLYRSHSLGIAGYVIAGLIGAFALLFVVGMTVEAYIERKKKLEAAATAWYMDESELPFIVCSTTNVKATNVNQLPKKKRSFHLRFQELKTQVCRPFSA